MGRLATLLKACMTEDMNIFQIRAKKRGASSKVLPVFLVIIIGFSIWSYANMLLDVLLPMNAGFVMLTLFVIITSILTLVEGVYKSGSLLFNCKDDDLMLSLPIKRSTVLFVRIFKLYVFELLYNALFLVPAMIAYAMRVEFSATFVISSVVATILLPVIPIAIACPIGAAISGLSSRFKAKNMVQTVLIVALGLAVLYASWNLDGVLSKIAAHATSINDFITKVYYPAGAYVGLVTDFEVLNLVIFILVNTVALLVVCLVLGKVYFRINSRTKIVKTNTRHSGEYRIKTRGVMRALVKKEFKKFINSPVFIVNAGFSMVLFVVGCIILAVNSNGTTTVLQSYGVEGTIDIGHVMRTYAPMILLGLLLMAALMGSITSSMISLEGKSFNILKSLPVKPYTVIMSKVLTAMIIMMPFLVVGDIVMFVKFDFNLLEILMILVATVIFPAVAEIIGIIINLKYPKMDAKNDAEVVKQSMSSTVAVFLGMALLAISVFLMVKALNMDVPMDVTMAIVIAIYMLLAAGLMVYTRHKGTKMFKEITA